MSSARPTEFYLRIRPLLSVRIDLLAWVFLLILHNAFLPSQKAVADVITLKNGKVIEGSVETREGRVVIRPWNSDGSIILESDRIESVVQKDLPVLIEEQAVVPDETSNAVSMPAAKGAQPDITLGTSEAGRAQAAPTSDGAPASGAIPEMPKIEYFYMPIPDAQIRAAVESVFPHIVRVCVEDMGLSFHGYVPLHFRIVADTNEFDVIQKTRIGVHANLLGFYSPKDDRIIVRGDSFRLSTATTLYHESTHALLRREFIDPPCWIDEGLAEFFGGFRFHGRQMYAGDPNGRDSWAKYFLVHQAMIPLEEYLHLSNDEWRAYENPEPSMFKTRIMAWSLISFLMSDEEGQVALRRYLQALKQSPRGDALDAAYKELDAAYPGGVSALQNYWYGWILGVRKPMKF